MKPFFLKAPCKDYLWGGNRLREYGKISDADKIAESWELSCHPDGESVIASGEYAGMTLTAFLKQHPEALGRECQKFDRFPVLIKLIDAHDNLSVQVHPDNEYALEHEGEYGKTEMWYIVDAEPGAELLYGFSREVAKEEFRRSIEENTLLDIVRHVPVKKGDVFFIPAGTLHAIGKGILIAEVQQNSNTTYRVYDYGRVGADGKPRALHIEKALDVTHLTPMQRPEEAPPYAQNGVTMRKLSHCPYFSAELCTIEEGAVIIDQQDSFLHILVTEGTGELSGGGERFPLKPGDSVFVPAENEIILRGQGLTVLLTEV